MDDGLRGELAEVNAALSRLRLQVNPDNVLQMHHDLADLVLRLSDEIRLNGNPVQVGVAADESVSKMAANAFTTKIRNLVSYLSAYRDALQHGVAEIKSLAVRYGHTEQEIQRSFDRFQAGTR